MAVAATVAAMPVAMVVAIIVATAVAMVAAMAAAVATAAMVVDAAVVVVTSRLLRSRLPCRLRLPRSNFGTTRPARADVCRSAWLLPLWRWPGGKENREIGLRRQSDLSFCADVGNGVLRPLCGLHPPYGLLFDVEPRR
jgi:hypothetical protein